MISDCFPKMAGTVLRIIKLLNKRGFLMFIFPGRTLENMSLNIALIDRPLTRCEPQSDEISLGCLPQSFSVYPSKTYHTAFFQNDLCKSSREMFPAFCLYMILNSWYLIYCRNKAHVLKCFRFHGYWIVEKLMFIIYS